MAEDYARTERIHSATGSKTITASDADGAVVPTSVGIQVDGGGTFRATFADGSVDTLTLNAGITYSYQVTKVWATGTTATGIHALYN